MADAVAPTSSNTTAEPKAEKWWNRPVPARPFWKDALHIFAIFNFAVAYPLLERVGQNGWFLVAERASTVDILLVALIPCILIPGILAAILGLVQVASAVVRSVLHVFLIAVFSVIGLQFALGTVTGANLGSPLSMLVVGIGIAGALLYLYSHAIQFFTMILLLSVIAVPAQFLFMSEVSQILFAGEPEVAEEITVDSSTPVVVIVYDELPLQSLLDRNLEIDAVRYPNFARLADDSHWFQNATTVQESSRHALPAIATGTFPDISRTPTASQYPRNLFTLLQHSHYLLVSEPATQLCPTTLCENQSELELGRFALASRALAAPQAPPVTSAIQRPDFDVSVARNVSDSNPPAAVFMHSMLPHHPWRHLPSGSRFVDREPHLTGLGPDRHWMPDSAITLHLYQRHLLQVEYTDSLLGDLLDQLESEDIYDDALLILTSDHGISFQPEEPYRHYEPQTATDIALVPFFVKLPGQSEQVISERNVEIIDILPTVVDILDIDVRWAFDGQSVFSHKPEREQKTLVHNLTGEHVELPAIIDGLEEAVDHKVSLFGDGSDSDGLFAYGPFGELFGVAVEDLELADGADIHADLDTDDSLKDVDPDGSFIPALIQGEMTGGDQVSSGEHIAIAVNGVIRAVPEVFELDGRLQFAAVVPEDSFVEGENDVEIFIVLRDDETVVLQQVTID